ncbi:hypothetical protein CS0771_45310 [Catellatospora sp. IY07-71]|uniref:hypothetical protein n=1 Tax=Catellatospora sp. IY07-71 TaxID=2728827 RepID=UPI001BB39CC2|nr:hypothetical protein [Catellatospora sp. IY07-71]BCJ74987.1 hypothetical protein CS0771_45310 [Catellatospora sp. IY07-71]
MPEQTGREPLADAFFQFRMQAPEEIVVPGAPAAHRTVRRRRTARVSAVAALTALVLAAGGYSAASLSAPAPADPATPSAAPSPTVSAGPTLGPQQLRRLSVSALERLGMKPGKVRRGAVYGSVDDATDRSGYSLGTAEQPLPTGRYTLFVICRGVGRIAVTWQADSGRGTIDAPCVDPAERFPPTQHVEVWLHVPGLITLSVSGDDVARARSGFAVMVNDPLMTIAETALQRTGGSGLGGGVGMVTGETENVHPDAAAGTYVLQLTCAGTGTIKATLKMGSVSAVKTVRCSEQPSRVTITITSKRVATLKVLMSRDPKAPQVAVADTLWMK